MLLAVCRCLAAFGVKRWPRHAGGLQALLAADIDHAYFSMLLAVKRLLAALYIETCSRCARVIQAVLLANVDNSGLSMSHAVCRCLASHYVKAWSPRARGIGALFDVDLYHAILSMLIAVRRRVATFKFEVRLLRAESSEQCLRTTFTMLSSACCLQYTAFMLPSTLKFGCLEQESRE